MLGQRRRRWANIDLILFPEFYKQTIKKNNKKMKSRVVGRGLWVEGRGGRGGFRDIRLRRRSSGKPALQIGPTSPKFAGHIWLEIHLISDRHSLYRPNMGDWLMLTIKIIHILWRQVGSSANSGGIRLESYDGRYLSLVHTYAATQTVQIRGIMTTETYS